MKKIIVTLFGSLALTLTVMTAAVAGPKPTWGEHGMALFGGKDGLYASHLPMFHAPHDYQVVLQFHLADAALDSTLRRRLDGKTALWTIAPEKFEIDRLAPGAAAPLTQFKANLVLGRFEQKGTTEYTGATVVIDKVLLFRQLSGTPRNSAAATYRQIGSGRQRFLIKEIDSRPDFDHIVAFTGEAGASTGAISVPKQALHQPADQALAAALQAVLGAAPALRGSVYFYTDDLK